MNALRETLLALFFAGWLILLTLKVGFNTKEHTISTRHSLTNQENLHVLTNIIEYDFRKIGHGLINPFGAISIADSEKVTFSYDQNPTTTYDSIRVEYSLANALSTKNPNDKLLIRKINNQNKGNVAFGITRFKLRYFNYFGTELQTPVISDSLSKITEIEISMTFESTEGIRNNYANAKYHTRIIPKNLLIQFTG